MPKLEALLKGQGQPSDRPLASQMARAVLTLLERGGLPLTQAARLLQALRPILPHFTPQDNTLERWLPACFGDRFIVTAPLGAGGSGMVLKAVDLLRLEAGEAGYHVALKLAETGADRDIRRLFSEWHHAQAVSHPHIASIHDVAKAGNHVFMVREFVPGLSLKELMRREEGYSPPLARTNQLVLQLASALSAFHTAHRIHGDVKPANIICRPDGLIKLIDFSAVQIIPHLEAGRWIAGTRGTNLELTPAYASPERLEGADPDPSDDVFSFAVTLCEMLQAHPFGGFALIGQSPLPDPSLPTRLTRQGRRAMLKALAPRRRDRWPTMHAFVEALHLPY